MAGKPGIKPVPFVIVLAMREARAQGVKLRELAERYGLNESTVSRICRGDAHAQEGGPRTRKYTRSKSPQTEVPSKEGSTP